MLLTFKFKGIHNNPEMDIQIDDISYFRGPVDEQVNISIDKDYYVNFNLKIYFTNKNPNDTVIDNDGNIIEDKNFELDDIYIDNESIENYRWAGVYCFNENIIDSCLFFGPAGYFELTLAGPGNYKHIQTTTDYPDWKEQYENWVWAKQILKELKN